MTQKQVAKSKNVQDFNEKLAKSHKFTSGHSLSNIFTEKNTVLLLDEFGKISEITETENGITEIQTESVEQSENSIRLSEGLLLSEPSIDTVSSGDTIKAPSLVAESEDVKNTFQVVDGSELDLLDDEHNYILNLKKAHEVAISVPDEEENTPHLVKQFNSEKEADEFIDKIHSADKWEISISSDGFMLDASEEFQMGQVLLGYSLLFSNIIIISLFFLTSFYITSFLKSITTVSDMILSHLLLTFILLSVIMFKAYMDTFGYKGQDIIRDGRANEMSFNGFTELDSEQIYTVEELQSVDVQRRNIDVVTSNDDVILKADDIEWTFDAYNGYPLEEALSCFEDIGHEKINNGQFCAKTVKMTQNTNIEWSDGYKSDCGEWYLFSDDTVIDN